jgi:hypothetical protein
MAREVFISVMPMLSVTGGTLDISSTPMGKQGFFYDCSKDPTFNKFYVSAEDCPRHKKEFLETQKEQLTSLEYAQEYLAMFLDNFKRIFSDEWIKKVCVLRRDSKIAREHRHYLGLDLARMGEDLTCFAILKRTSKRPLRIKQVENILTKKTYMTETENRLLQINDIYGDCLKEINIDAGAGSMGVIFMDYLLKPESKVKDKVRAINNREMILDREGKAKKKLLKEDLYNNLLSLGEHGFLELLNDDEIIASLSSVQYEYVVKAGKMSTIRIYGNNTHATEAIIRAAWAASNDSQLDLWVR